MSEDPPTRSPRDTINHADELIATVHDDSEPDLDALKVTDAMGTTIWLAPYEDRDAWQVYIRSRERYDSDMRRDETPATVRQLLAEAIADELNGLGTAVNYTARGETPI